MVFYLRQRIKFAQYTSQKTLHLNLSKHKLEFQARRDLYQDTVNESLLMRPGQYLTRSMVFLLPSFSASISSGSSVM